MASPNLPDAETVFEQAQDLLTIHRPADAEARLRAALTRFPDDARLHGLLSRAERDQGREQEALRSLQRAIGLDPNDEWLYRLYSIALLWSKDGEQRVQKALEMAKTALRLDPESLGGLLCLFDAQITANEKDAARSTAERLLKVAPDSADAHYCRGRLSLSDEELLWAKKHFLAALALSPEKSEAHYLLGRTFERQGKTVEARDAFLRAVKLSPCSVRFKEAFRSTALQTSALFYGVQTPQPYGVPVQFCSVAYTPHGPHTSRARVRFPDFSLKFKKRRDIKIPFYGSLSTHEFAVTDSAGAQTLVCRPGSDVSAPACGFQMGDQSYVLELGKSELFDELAKDLLVVRPCAILPEASGVWLLMTNFSVTREDLLRVCGDLTLPFREENKGLIIERDRQRLLVTWPKPQDLPDPSADQKEVLSIAKRLLEAPVTSIFSFHFQGPTLAEEILSRVATQWPLARLDVFAYQPDPSAPPIDLRGHAAPAPGSSEQTALTAGLPEKPTGANSWQVLLGAVVQPEAWCGFVRSLAGTVLDEARAITEIHIQSHKVKMEFLWEDFWKPLAPPFHELTGQDLRMAMRWQFNSLPLAAAILQSVQSQWPCLIWRGPIPGTLHRSQDVGANEDPGFPVDPNQNVGAEKKSGGAWDLLVLGRDILPEEWKAFIRDAGGMLDPSVDDGLNARFTRGLRFLRARPEPRTLLNMGVSPENRRELEAQLGQWPRTLVSAYSNDRAWLVDFARRFHSRWPCAIYDVHEKKLRRVEELP